MAEAMPPTAVGLIIVVAGLAIASAISVVIPAKAGIHIPETPVWGTMGPRFRGDDSAEKPSAAFQEQP
jgi:hypothetical protein